MATKLQIIADSNSTYVDNSTGNITPTTVKALNTDWINSTVFAEQTSSMSVATASFAILASTASFVAGNVASASTSISASYAFTASSAERSTTASFALTASSTPNAIITGSVSANILTFTKGNGTSFTLTVAQSGSSVSSSYSDFSNQANSASLAQNSLLLQGTGSNGFATTASLTTVSSSLQAVSASNQQLSASYIALSASYNVFSGSASTRITNNSASISALNTATASFAVLSANQTFSGINTFNNAVTMSNVRVTGTASIAFLDVTFQSSSIIYSSGSNQFGDASNDTQTLWGTVNVISGPLVVTGSTAITGSLTVSGSIKQFVDSGSKTSTITAVTNSFVGNTHITGSGNGNNALRVSGSGNFQGSLTVSKNLTLGSQTAVNTSTLSVASATGSLLYVNTVGTIVTSSFLLSTTNIVGNSGSSLLIESTFGDLKFKDYDRLGSINPTFLTIDSYDSGNPSIPTFTRGLVVTGSLNAQAISSSFSGSGANVFGVVSSSYAYTASSAVNAASSISASYALSASFAQKSVNTIVVTNNGAVNYILDGVANPVVTFVPGETYYFDTSGVVGSHPFRFSLTANGPTTYDVGVTVGTNYTEIEVDYATSSSLFYYCTNHSGMGNQANTLRSENLINASQTGSMTVLSASYAYTASSAVNAASSISASYAYTASSATSASFAVSASYANNFLISGSQIITGSLYGSPISQSVSSLTASLNLARGNFFNLTLPASANTYITASGQLPGQTINLKITQGATSGSVSLGAGIRQVSGSSYTVTANASTTDILTFISFDNTGLYVSSVKNLI